MGAKITKYRDDLGDKGRELRNNPTDAERYLWSRLNRSQLCGCKFRRQQPIGKYIADFVCFEKNLIIELDGGQHSDTRIYDKARDKWLKDEGFVVLRFWNNEVMQNIDGVADVVMEKLR